MKCPHCGGYFSTEMIPEVIYKIHWNDKKEINIMKCPHCGKYFSSEIVSEVAFKIHWYDKKESVIHGFDIEDAFRKAGYGGGILRAIDYWEKIEPNVDPGSHFAIDDRNG
jgi:rRNA maturation protein Nop10